MRRYLKVMVACVLYNAVAIMLDVVHGGNVHWLNVASMVGCSVAVFGHVAIARHGRLTLTKQGHLGRRIFVFLLGGFICPHCGDARVRLGGRYLFCFTCPNCDRFFFVRGEPSIKRMWRAVWDKYPREGGGFE